MILLCFYCFGDIILMLILFDQLKTKLRRIRIISQIIPQKLCHPPSKKNKQLEGKETVNNPLEILMMKVCS